MYTLNGAILKATGGPTVNDGLRAFFLANGATSGSLNDLAMQFLASKGFSSGALNDRWMAYLASLGYNQPTLNEREFWYWNGLAASPPAIDFSADQLTIDSGGSVGLTWVVQGAVTITASATPANAQWTGAKPESGQAVITNLTADQRFTLSATNANGTTTVNVDIQVVAQSITASVTVGQDATPDYFGFNSLAGYGAMSPTAIFGGTVVVLIAGWNGLDEILLTNTGATVFPDVGTGQIKLTVAGAAGSPYTLTWNGTYYRLATDQLAYFLSTKVGQAVQMILEPL